MKTIKDCKTIEEALTLLEDLISKSKNDKLEFKLKDDILISNLLHDLDVLLHYEKSKPRKI